MAADGRLSISIELKGSGPAASVLETFVNGRNDCPRLSLGKYAPDASSGKALTDHIFGLIAAGETDEKRLVVSGLSHLKSLEKMVSEEAKKVGSHSGSVPEQPEGKSLPDKTLP